MSACPRRAARRAARQAARRVARRACERSIRLADCDKNHRKKNNNHNLKVEVLVQMSLSFTLFGLHTSCRKSRISVHLVNIVTIVESGWSEGLFVKMVCSILVVTCNFVMAKYLQEMANKSKCAVDVWNATTLYSVDNEELNVRTYENIIYNSFREAAQAPF
ncbi:uncharacterized protein LOC124633992 [Helicoverpa zea]|uniref:uncharacterized protein LOC124633992 n=1 Tax=Helicoverpa zea TaxID=7113 RepID=UPI001F55D19B|nr:uncharacterized protein LOC124633992 [Helicoverpa zea]